jgi:hypothetical protein
MFIKKLLVIKNLKPEAEIMNVQCRGIILRVLRLQVSVYNVYITNQFQTTFAQGGWGVNPLVKVTE